MIKARRDVIFAKCMLSRDMKSGVSLAVRFYRKRLPRKLTGFKPQIYRLLQG